MEENSDTLDIQVEGVCALQEGEEVDESRGSPLTGKYYKQAYRQAWEQLPDFKGWLRGVEGEPTRAFCTYCRVTLFAHRLSLLKHTCTLKHQKAAQRNLIHQTHQNNAVEASESSEYVTEPRPTGEQNIQYTMETPKLQLRPLLKQQTSGVTVTIIQDGSEEHLKLKMNDTVCESTGVMPNEETEVVDVGGELNPPVTVEIHEESEELSFLPDMHINKTHKKVPTLPQSIMYPLSTHVLDTSKGQPVSGVQVSLYRLIDGRWTFVNEGVTSQDGRCSQLIQKADFVAGRFKLHFDTDKYFELERKESLYPFIEIVFDVHAPQEHYHIPLLLSPFGYTTYRGS